MTDKAKDKNDKGRSKKVDKSAELQLKIDELTMDLKRTRADFENYRKRVEIEKEQARTHGKTATVVALLPAIDSIERATLHVPEDIADHSWVKGVASLTRQLDKILAKLQLKRIESSEGTVFDPDVHEAIQVDESATGSTEVIAEELQAGYVLADQVVRPALVKVTRK